MGNKFQDVFNDSKTVLTEGALVGRIKSEYDAEMQLLYKHFNLKVFGGCYGTNDKFIDDSFGGA